MSLPRFFSRVGDSISPLLASATDSASLDVREFLERKSIVLRGPDDLDRHQHHLAGFALLANLCARLYPTIRAHRAIGGRGSVSRRDIADQPGL